MSKKRTVGIVKHGLRRHPLYSTWDGMMSRCHNPSARNYAIYGGRGIRVSDDWQNIANFIRDIPPKPEGQWELDRIDNDGNYEFGNVRWVTRRENSLNRRDTVWVDYEGQKRLLVDVCAELGFNIDTIRNRIRRGDAEIFRPLGPGKRDVKKKKQEGDSV